MMRMAYVGTEQDAVRYFNSRIFVSGKEKIVDTLRTDVDTESAGVDTFGTDVDTERTDVDTFGTDVDTLRIKPDTIG
ncbi:MAG: hypothetical protein LBS42_00090 [Tannerella sp.]|jgi:hypothetical protein|nr:hypothetical protein [Tannerella sp.]